MLNKIDQIKKQIIIQAGTVESMLENFIENLKDKDKEKLKEIFILENKVNAYEIAIEEDAIAMIALNQPEGKNLRTVVMILKMNNDLERIGDLITDISNFYIVYLESNNFINIETPILMAKKSQEMLRESIESFKKEDCELARNVCKKDDIVDDLHAELRNEIIKYIKTNPEEIRMMFDFYDIIFKIERIADLATNIAEEAIYLSEGKDIKHGQFD
ncbi:MAG: phosphate signaling complex protein PhoU [Candidatus Cloacimonadota bacterium]|nr:phosphate signaling complex protein PhoU [Candidatus Cloacimonadota bacterium]